MFRPSPMADSQMTKIVELSEKKSELCTEILLDLPEWFGIPAAVQRYGEEVAELPLLGCLADGKVVGILSLKQHFPATVEIHLIAVRRRWHRRGLGRGLVLAAESRCRERGVNFLMVKTVGPSCPDEGYRGTRRFYETLGFHPLEELHGLWPDDPCLLMLKSL